MMQHQKPHVLSITGSDSTGKAGIQADIQTISTLGGRALTSITCVTVQNNLGIHAVHNLPTEIVVGQVQATFQDSMPQAVKVGLVRDVNTVLLLGKTLIGCPNLVCDPGMLSSRGEQLVDETVRDAILHCLLPHVKVLTIKCAEASLIFGYRIHSAEDMILAARQLLEMGPEAVLMQGGHSAKGTITDILLQKHDAEAHFFAVPDVQYYSMHGASGTLSTAIATYLAQGDTIRVAVGKAHTYMQSLLVYAVPIPPLSRTKSWVMPETQMLSRRKIQLYNELMALVARYYKTQHEVAFYAGELNVTPRYLSQITHRVSGKSPKLLITDYLLHEIEQALVSTSADMQQLALEYGFPSGAMFSKFFRQHTQTTPTEFRRRHV